MKLEDEKKMESNLNHIILIPSPPIDLGTLISMVISDSHNQSLVFGSPE